VVLAGVLERARDLGYLGPGPVEDHITHALGFAVQVPNAPRRALDLGSGGGVPGLALATLAWPVTAWTLLDASARRCAFLTTAVAELGMTSRVAVIHGRAEDYGRAADLRGRADLVVARSFGSPSVTAECGAPLLAVGGHLVVSEPPDGGSEGRWPGGGLDELGLERAGSVDAAASYAVFVARRPCPDRFPRRPGVPSKRPLWPSKRVGG
jgi:16S rRNA (guanine527-N7)-methyltransferase